MLNPWRGYIPLDNKKRSMMAFKDVPSDKLLSKKEAEKFDSYAGVLAEDVVILDFDDPSQAECAMTIVEENSIECVKVKTDRGWHLIFLENEDYPKNTVGQKLACGLKCDIKAGRRNSYEVLKLKGSERRIFGLGEEQLVPAPCYFRPVDSDTELFGLDEGQGRNETLFGYMMTLTNRGFTAEECKETAEVINRNVFARPMDTAEFNTVTREEAFVLQVPSFKDKAGHFKHNEFGDWLLQHENIVKISGMLHVYKDGIYRPGEEEIERVMIDFLPDLPMAKRKEVFEYLHLKIRTNTKIADARYIPFQNGIYDMVEKTLLPFSPDIVVTNAIPHSFDANAKNPLVITTLKKLACQDMNIYNLLCECIGYIFWRRNELGASFFLLGDKSNGKSTFISMLNFLLGEQNMCALDLADFSKEFRAQELFGKLANLGDDIESDFINETGMFKKIATGNYITVSPKYEKPFMFKPYAKLIFSANEMPRMNDKTGAALRRIVPIQFNATFSKTDPDFDPYIIYKLNTEEGAQTLINLGLKGLDRVLVNNEFTTYKGMNDSIKAIAETNNPLLVWVSEFGADQIINHSVDGTYGSYTIWCHNSELKPISKLTWVDRINKELGTKCLMRDNVGTGPAKIKMFIKVEE